MSKTPTFYFDSTVDQAIALYCAETDKEKRDQIFMDRIYAPFLKLCECVFNKFGFDYIDDTPENTQLACVSHLSKALDKYDPNRVSKKFPNKKVQAFGYFSTISKNYYIYLNDKSYKERKRTKTLDVDEEHLASTEAEIHQAIADFGPNDNTESTFFEESKETFENLCRWAEANNRITDRQKGLLKQAKGLICGEIPFVKHQQRDYPAIKHSLGTYGNLVILKTLLRKYRKSQKYSSTPTYQYSSKYPFAPPIEFCGVTRTCPSCGQTITHNGKLAKYQAAYAHRLKSKCRSCSHKYVSLKQL